MNQFDKEKAAAGCTKLGILACCLAVWYNIHPTPNNQLPTDTRYPLPEELVVVKTDLPFSTKKNEEGLEQKVIKTNEIDFSKDFVLETERYKVIKNNDFLISIFIGQILSMPPRLFFWDWDIHLGLDKDRTKSVISALETNKDIKDITVRINHNEAFKDWYRMMTDDKLTKRNPWLYRITFGSLTTLKDEMLAELGRGDYYNPLTRTTVVYSNVESIFAHEIGHNKDFSRFKTDWIYCLSRILPPVMLYQEMQASIYANGIMSKSDDWQFNRYLVPAFATYCLAMIGMFMPKRKKEE